MMCLNNENWSLACLSFNIKSILDTFKFDFPSNYIDASSDRLVKWNNNNHFDVILNIDGSCICTAIRVGYGGVLRNNASFYLSGFSKFIQDNYDIIYAKLFAIYQGLLLVNDLEIIDLVCYFDSLYCITLILWHCCLV